MIGGCGPEMAARRRHVPGKKVERGTVEEIFENLAAP